MKELKLYRPRILNANLTIYLSAVILWTFIMFPFLYKASPIQDEDVTVSIDIGCILSVCEELKTETTPMVNFGLIQIDADTTCTVESVVRIDSKDHLTARRGVYEGPSGRETWYNLDMDRVVDIMRKLGFSEEEYPYHVNSNGVKMLGDYVMVAANLDIRPKGTVLETSLGKGLVCDTGTFVEEYPDGIDIATDW